MSEISNAVLTPDVAAQVQTAKPKRGGRKPSTRTLESQPASNRAARSTPVAIPYFAIVKECANHKVTEGESFVSRKGKSHLKALVCDAVGSHLGLNEEQRKNLSTVDGGAEILSNIDSAIVAFFSQITSDIIGDFHRKGGHISIRTRFAFDRIKEVKQENGTSKREYEFGIAASMRGERPTVDTSEARRTLNVLKAKHQKRMDYMLEHKDDPHPDTGVAPRFGQKQLKLQRERIVEVTKALDALPPQDSAVTPDAPRDLQEHYRRQQGK